MEFNIATVQSCLGVIEKKYNRFLSKCLPGELPYFPDYCLQTIHIQKVKFHPIWTIYRCRLYKDLFFSKLLTVTGREEICEQSILMIQASLWANTRCAVYENFYVRIRHGARNIVWKRWYYSLWSFLAMVRCKNKVANIGHACERCLVHVTQVKMRLYNVSCFAATEFMTVHASLTARPDNGLCGSRIQCEKCPSMQVMETPDNWQMCVGGGDEDTVI